MRISIKISPNEFKPDDQADVSYFFSKLAEASRLGYHKVMIKKELEKFINEEVLLITKHKDRIKDIIDNPSTMGFPNDGSITFMEVEHGNKKLTEENLENGVTKWSIGHNVLLKNNFLEQPGLLVEGFDDCDLFEFLLRVIRHSEVVSFDAHPMGGHTGIGKGLKKHAQRRGIIVGIMDSDMFTPNGKKNDGFEVASNVSKELNSIICMVTCTPCHEAENFLPVDIIHEATNNNSVSTVNNLKSLMDNPKDGWKGDCVSLYYDYKKGITQADLKKYCKQNYQFEWVREKYGFFFKNNHSSSLIPILGYNVFKYLQEKKRKNGLPVFGRTIIRDFLKDENLKNEFKNYINGNGKVYWDLHFADWLQKFIPYFIGEIPSISTEKQPDPNKPKYSARKAVRCLLSLFQHGLRLIRIAFLTTLHK